MFNNKESEIKNIKRRPKFLKLQQKKRSAVSSSDKENNVAKSKIKDCLSKIQDELKEAKAKFKMETANIDDSESSSEDEPKSPILNRSMPLKHIDNSKIIEDTDSSKKPKINTSVESNSTRKKNPSNIDLIRAANLSARNDVLQKIISISNDAIDNIIHREEMGTPKSILKTTKSNKVYGDSDETDVERKLMPLTQRSILKKRQSIEKRVSFRDVFSSTQIPKSQDTSSSSEDDSSSKNSENKSLKRFKVSSDSKFDSKEDGNKLSNTTKHSSYIKNTNEMKRRIPFKEIDFLQLSNNQKLNKAKYPKSEPANNSDLDGSDEPSQIESFKKDNLTSKLNVRAANRETSKVQNNIEMKQSNDLDNSGDAENALKKVFSSDSSRKMKRKKCESIWASSPEADERTSKKRKKEMSMNERIQKPADLLEIQPKHNDGTICSNMKEFLMSNLNVQQIHSETKFVFSDLDMNHDLWFVQTPKTLNSNFSDLDKNDEIWFLQTPKTLDSNLLREKIIKYRKGKYNLNVGGTKYECDVQQSQSNICLCASQTAHNKKLITKSIQINGTIVVREVLKETDIKLRHPTSGHNFPDKNKLNESTTDKNIKIQNKREQKSTVNKNKKTNSFSRIEMIFQLLRQKEDEIYGDNQNKLSPKRKKLKTKEANSDLI